MKRRIEEIVGTVMAQTMANIHVAQITTISPLSISILADPQQQPISESVIEVPRHLTDYTINCDISSGTLTSSTNVEQSHSHTLDTFTLSDAQITLKNSLQVDELVWVLSYNSNQRYVILGRVV